MSDELKIESGIPVPPPHFGRKSRLTCVLEKMQPGDSVLFTLRNEAQSFQQSLRGRGFDSVRRCVEGGWRVWKGASKKTQ